MTARALAPGYTGCSRVLVIEDDPLTLNSLVEALGADGREICQSQDGGDALRRIRTEEAFDLIVTPILIPNADGYSILREARERKPEARVILLTTYGEIEEYLEAMDQGAFDYLAKPLRPADLRRALDRALGRSPVAPKRPAQRKSVSFDS